MGTIFTTFLLILLGLSLTPAVQDTVDAILVNVSGIVAMVVELVPLIWVFLIIGIGAAAVYAQFKEM